MTQVDERAATAEGGDHVAARRAMIDSQLRTSGVNQPWVIDAVRAIPREHYVPDQARAMAYIDRSVPLGGGRFLCPPVVSARMLEEARPAFHDSVLLVDGGSGYMAALLGRFTPNLEVVDAAAGASGATAQDGYSVLVIDGAVGHLPDALTARLAPDARVVTGLDQRGVTRLAVGRRSGNAVALLPVQELGMPVLPEFAELRRWSF